MQNFDVHRSKKGKKMHSAQEYEPTTESSKVVKFFILLFLLYSCFLTKVFLLIFRVNWTLKTIMSSIVYTCSKNIFQLIENYFKKFSVRAHILLFSFLNVHIFVTLRNITYLIC